MSDAHIAANFILSHCPHIGSFSGDSSPHAFIKETAAQLSASPPSELFPDRYKEHVAYALDLVGTHGFLSPPSAIGSVYLATRFELYFRVLSAKLNRDGSWISPAHQQAAALVISDNRINRSRVSSVSLAYKIMMLENSTFTSHCKHLDGTMFRSPDTKIRNIGDRIEWLRHRAGHGEWGDISGDAVFYGLMTALVFFCTR